MYDVVIIGGGLAGLSAAVELTSLGKSILLLEQRQHLGGRTFSFVDDVTGDVVDNGQHLMMGCYHETRRYLRRVGAEHLATLQPNLHIVFLRPEKPSASLVCPSLPSPLHILAGLMNLNSVPFSHRLRLLNVGKELLWTSRKKERALESITVDEWLTDLGQTEDNKNYLWNILAIGTLNDDPKSVSALLFFRVLRAAFLGAKENSSLLVPRVGLSELFVQPAETFLREHGVELKTGIQGAQFNLRGGRIESVRHSNEDVRAKSFISAVPHYDLHSLFQDDSPGQFSFVSRIQSSPIITINLWFDREVLKQEFAAVLDSRIQWVFNRTRMLRGSSGKSGTNNQYLSLVISGAAKFVEMEKEELVTIALEDLRQVLPAAHDARLIQSIVVKEKRATFTSKPGVEALRPDSKTPIENLFLAGDWTGTGFPATIEGAVLSGRKAAEAAAGLSS